MHKTIKAIPIFWGDASTYPECLYCPSFQQQIDMTFSQESYYVQQQSDGA